MSKLGDRIAQLDRHYAGADKVALAEAESRLRYERVAEQRSHAAWQAHKARYRELEAEVQRLKRLAYGLPEMES